MHINFVIIVKTKQCTVYIFEVTIYDYLKPLKDSKSVEKSLVRNFWARKRSKNGFLTINEDFEGVKNVTLKVHLLFFCSTVLLGAQLNSWPFLQNYAFDVWRYTNNCIKVLLNCILHFYLIEVCNVASLQRIIFSCHFSFFYR